MVTEQDLVRIEAAVTAWRAHHDAPDRTCEDMGALVAEVRRLRAALRDVIDGSFSPRPGAITEAEAVASAALRKADEGPAWQRRLIQSLERRGWSSDRVLHAGPHGTWPHDVTHPDVTFPLLEAWRREVPPGTRGFRADAARGEQPALATVTDADRVFVAAAIADRTSMTEALCRALWSWAEDGEVRDGE